MKQSWTIWTIERILSEYDKINEKLSWNVKPIIKAVEKDKFPMSRRNGELIFVPKFFNDEGLNDDERFMLIATLYSCVALDIHKNGWLINNPQFLTKGICETMGYKYIPDYKLENSMRAVRNRIYDEPEYYCYFSVGDDIKPREHTRLLITGITKGNNNEVLVEVKPNGYKPELYLGKTIFTEKELFELWDEKRDLSDVEIDMRKNLYVLSGPSCVGKTTIFNALKERLPYINKTISITNRPKRINEIDGKDYYFCTEDEMHKILYTPELVEDTIHDGYYYATLRSEIERFSNDSPVFLILDVSGKASMCLSYPLTKSIFIMPSSLDVLRGRMISRGENTEEKIENRLEDAKWEIERSKYYNYVITNDGNIDDAVEKIIDILKNNGAID